MVRRKMTCSSPAGNEMFQQFGTETNVYVGMHVWMKHLMLFSQGIACMSNFKMISLEVQ